MIRNLNCDTVKMPIEKIINIPISVGKYDDFVTKIVDLAIDATSAYVCILNVHMLVEAYFEKSFKKVIERADIITPDGLPITWALRWLRSISQERVAGMDLLPTLL